MSIGGISLEHFNELPHTGIKSSTKSCTHHAVFHSFLLDDFIPVCGNSLKCSSEIPPIDMDLFTP